MNLRPITLAQAKDFVREHHRHSKPTTGHKFSIGLVEDEVIIGCAVVGRPVARGLDDGYTAEVLRLVTLGHRNACSTLYGASRRACLAMGYRRVVTYIRADESGGSLKASGWWPTETVTPRGWSCKSRPRDDEHHEIIGRVRWETA